MEFGRFFAMAAGGADPYRYQERLAEDGLPEVLEVPTGAGKTLAVIAAWLWRRTTHPDVEVRRATPPRLAYVLPLRVLVEQTVAVASQAVADLGLAEKVAVYSVMGGEGRRANAWREQPEQPAIFVGTQDMLLSRALNRAYGESRFVAPIDFGVFNSGTHWLFDEVQLMGAALPTSRQLEGFRQTFGTAAPCASSWMSATVDLRRMRTVDKPDVATHLALTDDDRTGALAYRLDATKTVGQADIDNTDDARGVATMLLTEHRPGTRTIAVLNTVGRAVEVYNELRRMSGEDGPNTVLLHSRFRPPERATQVDAALAPPAEPDGTIVVTTQVLEAGVDVTSSTLFTEAAPWSSVVQRAGRCNRDGAAADARLLWAPPPKAAPYEDADVEACVQALHDLEGAALTPVTMSGKDVKQTEEDHAVLRRRDLLDLFDNAPDLSGNDIDVSRFIRDIDELDVQVAWRELDGRAPTGAPPTRDELCPAPVGDVRQLVRGARQRAVWRFDALDDQWVRAASEDIRPGRMLVLDAAQGGYDPATGWSPKTRAAVPVITSDDPDPQARSDEAVGSDYPTWAPGRWVPLTVHLADAERACAELLDAMEPLPGLSDAHRIAARVAARLHDIGKAHPVFQETMRASAGDGEPPGDGPWAKSGGPHRPPHARRHFRHELVSALLLLGGAGHLLDEVPPGGRDLAVYLVAAHHGKVRLAIRSLPEEQRPDREAARFALGVWDGDAIPETDVPGGKVPAATLDLDVVELGRADDGEPSWVSRGLRLRDDPDLGPFRLGFLESVVRLADWRASAWEERADA